MARCFAKASRPISPTRTGPSPTPIRCRTRFFFSSRRRHTRSYGDWSSDVCSSDLAGKVYRIGVEVSLEWTPVGPLTAVGMAAQQTGGAALMVLKGLKLMLSGRVPLRDLGGPIAIASAAGKQARAGGRYYLFTLAFLSVNLAVLNLLPIPALDGGHLAFFAIEGAMRRPLRARHREIALQVGILLLITLIVFVSYNDIHRLVWG